MGASVADGLFIFEIYLRYYGFSYAFSVVVYFDYVVAAGFLKSVYIKAQFAEMLSCENRCRIKLAHETLGKYDWTSDAFCVSWLLGFKTNESFSTKQWNELLRKGIRLKNPDEILLHRHTLCASHLITRGNSNDIKTKNLFHRNKESYCINDDMDLAKHSREALGELYLAIKSIIARDSIIDELTILMSKLNLKDDFTVFSIFYDFVFFICREEGQKNVTVSRAVAAWKLVLSGRFRLLNQWCDFVEKNQRHNISEDTWCQVLAFSRCVHEDLEGYDPEGITGAKCFALYCMILDLMGAWPVLIDDFVEHMYRITGSSCCISRKLVCSCSDPEGQPSACEDALPGLRGFPGLKRKMREEKQRKDSDMCGSLSLESLSLAFNSKRRKEMPELVTAGKEEENNPPNPAEPLPLSSPLRCSMSPCAVEQHLSKGFEGLLSFDQERTV